MNFVANLRPRTIEAFAEFDTSPAAYLLSTHRLTGTTRRYAETIRGQGTPLYADNGSKEHIDGVISAHRTEAREIARELGRIGRERGRIPRGGSVPLALRRRASALAHAVVDECERRSDGIDSDALLDAQLSMDPTHVVAQEDFAVACLIALGLERETTGWGGEYVARRNRRSLRLYDRVVADPRCADRTVYAVLSAMDYNTARTAGELAAQKGVEHVAFGAAGIMLDPSAVDWFVSGRATFRLEHVASRRYVRVAQIVRGIVDGYGERDSQLQSMHVLGLGAPTMLPLVATATGDDVETISIDATSPVHDAVRDHVVYDPESYGDRVRTLAVADRIVRGGRWAFDCPFCRGFRDRAGHDPDAARDWWERNGRPDLEPAHLQVGSPLADALPLFARGSGTSVAQNARIAHNHWVVDRLAGEIPDGPGRSTWADDRLDVLVEQESVVTARALQGARTVLQKS